MRRCPRPPYWPLVQAAIVARKGAALAVVKRYGADAMLEALQAKAPAEGEKVH